MTTCRLIDKVIYSEFIIDRKRAFHNTTSGKKGKTKAKLTSKNYETSKYLPYEICKVMSHY